MFEITPEVEEKYKNLIEAMQAKVFDNNKGLAPGLLIQKADKNVNVLKNEYSQILALEIQKFEKLYTSLSESNFFEVMEEIYSILHEVRGQAGTFGFVLLSTVAHEACKLIESMQEEVALDFKRLEYFLGVYYKAIMMVYSKGPKACYGKSDQQLVLGLQKVMKKYNQN